MASVRYLFLGAMLFAAPVWGEVPKVVTDIAPVHSLVAMVMGDLGRPDLIVTPGMSAHANALRPSQARALQQADLVIWMGTDLSPWLGRAIETLAVDADKMALLEMPETLLLNYHDTDPTNPTNHNQHSDTGTDPHAWLDPENGRIWLGLIADRMATHDPGNADIYRANALAGQRELATLRIELAYQLAPMRTLSYVTFHDAYQYFESRFGLSPIGAVTASDAASPGPARLAHLRELLGNGAVTCAFGAPDTIPGLLYAVLGREDIAIIPLDPLAVDRSPGSGLYVGLLRDLGLAFAWCVDRK